LPHLPIDVPASTVYPATYINIHDPCVFCIVFDCFTVTYKWRVLPLPSPNDDQYEQTPYHRYGHTAVAYGDRAYIFGGRNDKNGACNILFCFDAGNFDFFL